MCGGSGGDRLGSIEEMQVELVATRDVIFVNVPRPKPYIGAPPLFLRK